MHVLKCKENTSDLGIGHSTFFISTIGIADCSTIVREMTESTRMETSVFVWLSVFQINNVRTNDKVNFFQKSLY